MRYLFIDNLRGIDFIFMVIHHIFYFKDVSNEYMTSYADNIFVSTSGTIARTLFIFLVGLSLSLDKNNKKDKIKKRLNRSLEIFINALLITFITYMYFPSYFIRFGVLHFISLASLLGSYFVDKKKLTFISILFFLLIKPISLNNPIIDTITGGKTYYNMMDYFPLFPWFGLVLMGIFFGQTNDLSKIENKLSKINKKIFNENNILTKIGKNCLKLYTMHIVLLIIIYNLKKSN
jgi:uncharacterized membrane protein